MADKRMFNKKITNSDAFIELPASTQALYFHLNQEADDDGFNNQVNNAMFKAHATTDDLRVLMAKNFVIRFESGVIVIKHWRIHNTLRKDRYNPTSYQEELSKLGIKENGAYTLGCQMVAERLPNGCHSIDKNRLVESSIDKNSVVEVICDSDEPQPPKKVKHKYGEYNNVLLTDDELSKLKTEYSDYEERIERLSSYIASKGTKYKSHYATIRNWARKDKEQPKKSSYQDSIENRMSVVDEW